MTDRSQPQTNRESPRWLHDSPDILINRSNHGNRFDRSINTGVWIGYEWLGRRVLVTGASSGIGRETALILAAKGAQVCLLARNRPRLDRLALQIVAEGG